MKYRTRTYYTPTPSIFVLAEIACMCFPWQLPSLPLLTSAAYP